MLVASDASVYRNLDPLWERRRLLFVLELQVADLADVDAGRAAVREEARVGELATRALAQTHENPAAQ